MLVDGSEYLIKAKAQRENAMDEKQNDVLEKKGESMDSTKNVSVKVKIDPSVYAMFAAEVCQINRGVDNINTEKEAK